MHVTHVMPARWRDAMRRWKTPEWLTIHLAAGFVVSAAALWGFAAIAEDIPEHGAMDHLDAAIDAWLQTHGTERGEALFNAVSWLGSELVFGLAIVVAIGLFVRRRQLDAVLWVVALGGAVLLNNGLKLVFERTRPIYASEFVDQRTWSFPSGHATDTVVCYGMLVVLFVLPMRNARWRTALIAAASALVLLIGYSRLYLGVHFLSDVLAGFAVGTVWLLVCGWTLARARQRQRTRGGHVRGRVRQP